MAEKIIPLKKRSCGPLLLVGAHLVLSTLLHLFTMGIRILYNPWLVFNRQQSLELVGLQQWMGPAERL